MRVAIFGAGAIGGYLGVQLARSGVDVTLIARGAHLRAIRGRGLELLIGGERRVATPRATDDPVQAGPHDAVIVTVKTHSLPEVARAIAPLLGPDTSVITAMNGIPWWYFQGVPGPFEHHRLASVDPDGKLALAIEPRRILGAIAFASAEVIEPGVVQHSSGKRLVLGELDGAVTERATAISRMLERAGFDAPVTPSIREDLWVKLWLNLSFNPISVLTGGTLGGMATEPGTRDVARRMMTEARAVAERLGVTFRITVDDRLAQAANLGAHKTSMLQDLERGRPLELDPLVTAVQELGALVGVPTPTIDIVLALARARAARV